MDLYDYVGKRVILKAIRDSSHGMFLALDSCKTQVLLPKIYANNIHVNDEVEVFLYTDSEDRIIATTQMPLAFLDEIALLRVKDKVQGGIYLDIGLAKDIFMPTKNVDKYKIDSKTVVRISKDKQQRLIAKRDISPLLQPCKKDLTHHRFKALAYKKSNIGINVIIIPHYYHGIIYNKNLPINTFYDVRVVKSRDDGKLDLAVEYNSDELLNEIKKCNDLGYGFDINKSTLNMSKKGMKKELSKLISQREIIFVKNKGYFINKS